jgi:hypothetical protein
MGWFGTHRSRDYARTSGQRKWCGRAERCCCVIASVGPARTLAARPPRQNAGRRGSQKIGAFFDSIGPKPTTPRGALIPEGGVSGSRHWSNFRRRLRRYRHERPPSCQLNPQDSGQLHPSCPLQRRSARGSRRHERSADEERIRAALHGSTIAWQ